jgi:hypothetical protein
MCLAVSAAYVVILGVPAYVLLRKLNAIRWWSTTAVGFILGAIPLAILTWPLRYSELRGSASVNGVQTMVDGIPTAAGWLQYMASVSFFGLCGAVSALAFWVVSRNEAQQRAAGDARNARA